MENLETSTNSATELQGIDEFGRTTLAPNQSKICSILSARNPSTGFSYTHKVFAVDSASLLPPVSRVIERTEIRPGVVAVANWYGSIRQMHLIIMNKRTSSVRLKIVWTAFENMRVLRGAAGEVFVPAESEVVYAVMSHRDRDKAWKYRYSFRMIENATDPTLSMEIARDEAAAQLAIESYSEVVALTKQQAGNGGVGVGVGGAAGSAGDLSSPNSTGSSSSTSNAAASGDKSDDRAFERARDPDADEFTPEVEQKLSQQKLGFVDLKFPPVSTSILGPSGRMRRRQAMGSEYEEDALLHPTLRELTWKRISDVIGQESCTLLAPGDIDPRSVREGAAELPWFAASLAALAEKPDAIDRLFITRKPSTRGRYLLNMCAGGLRQSVAIDDYVPCYPLGGPAFTRCHGNELWAALVGKAYAKLHGGYSTLASGLAHDALQSLTGCPVDSLPIRQRGKALTDVWRKIGEWTRQGFIMVAVTDKLDSSSTGLLPRYPYTLLGSLPQLKPTDPQLLLLRAPLTQQTPWTGAWSAKSPLWQQQEAAGLRSHPPVVRMLENPQAFQDAGEFFMSFSDFCTHFRMLSVCFYRKDWQETRIPSQFTLQSLTSSSSSTSTSSSSPTNSLISPTMSTATGRTLSSLTDTTTSTVSSSSTTSDGAPGNSEESALHNPFATSDNALSRYGTNFYLVEVPERTSIFAAVHQREASFSPSKNDPNKQERMGYFASAVLIVKANPIPNAHPVEGDVLSQYTPGEVKGDSSLLLSRYNGVECHGLDPGTYFIIPYSTGPVAVSDAYPEVEPAAAAAAHDFVLTIHSLCPIKAMTYLSSPALLSTVLFASIKANGVVVNCNVPGLSLYDWCARKSAFFAVEMTDVRYASLILALFRALFLIYATYTPLSIHHSFSYLF